MTTYKVYEEKANKTIVLRMVTLDKKQAEKYVTYSNNHFKKTWIEKEA